MEGRKLMGKKGDREAVRRQQGRQSRYTVLKHFSMLEIHQVSIKTENRVGQAV